MQVLHIRKIKASSKLPVSGDPIGLYGRALIEAAPLLAALGAARSDDVQNAIKGLGRCHVGGPEQKATDSACEYDRDDRPPLVYPRSAGMSGAAWSPKAVAWDIATFPWCAVCGSGSPSRFGTAYGVRC
jgi:hypothetical protein